MAEQLSYLHQAVEDEMALFCHVEQAAQREKGATGRVYGDERLHARLSNCGVATAFVQDRLRSRYDIQTERLYANLTQAPRREAGNRTFEHVILRHESTLIDPTYGQLFSYVGIQPVVADADDLPYPRDLALLVDSDQPDSVLEPLASALEAAGTLERAQRRTYGPLRDVGRQAIVAVLRDIYTPAHYTLYERQVDDMSHDRITDLLCRAESY